MGERVLIKSIKIFIVLYSIVAGFLKAQECATVEISTNLPSSMIYLDNLFIGEGSIAKKLQPGDYELLVIERNRGWGAQKFFEQFSIESCENTIHYNFEFKKYSYIDSTPQNAAIIISDTILAFTPAWTPQTFGNIILSHQGYDNREISLSKDYSPEPIRLNFSGISQKERFVDSPWFTVLIGSAVVFGATAAYFKIQADQQFDKYTDTRDKSLLSDVDRYDLYSGISFGILQVNFGYLVYKFIFDKP